tara:strand:- start:374 stop:964 length:591 start_codon:yes stop_codon:yes gene_type:complete
MKKFVLIITFIMLVFDNNINAEKLIDIKRLTEGNDNAKIIIVTYESLTCSHCADFHKNVYPKLKLEFIDTGLAKIEFRHFPLDIAALNASKIAQCRNDGNSDLLHILYSNQYKWVKGKTIEDINNNLKILLKEKSVDLDFNKCTNNKDFEEYVLNDRIEGIKQFEINATPTIIINNEKFDKTLNYKNLKKYLEKLI